MRLRSGRPGRYPTPEEAAEYHFTPFEREIVKAWTASQIVGEPRDVRHRIEELLDRTGADELIVTTMMHGSRERLRSYELLAEALGLAPDAPEPVPGVEPIGA